ncbi:MAG TPA: TonB-dependent siderophore receptor [Nitrococcus sp.]|nr:TonB-dependent siderophore receptor [Nitrococcus sp.]
MHRFFKGGWPTVPARRPAAHLSPIAVSVSLIVAGYGNAMADEVTLPKVKVSADAESDYKPGQPESPRFTQPLLDTPQTVNVVPEAVIEQRSASTLSDVLRNVSGISMQAGEGGTPAGDQLSVRGFSARTDIFIDNVRDLGGYTRDPFDLEQVEVVKGPSSEYSGRGSAGGSINLVSKIPHLDDFTHADLTVGTDAYHRATLDVNYALPGSETAAVRFNAMYHEQDVAGRDVVRNKRWGVAPSIAFGLGTPTQATLSLFYMAEDNVPDYGIPWVPDNNVPLANYANKAPPVDFSNWYGLKKRDYEKTNTLLATVQVNHRFSDNVHLRNLTRYGRTDRDSITTAPRFASPDSTDITRSDWKSRDQSDLIVANLTDLTLDFTTGAVKHTLLLGAEASHENVKAHPRVQTGPNSPNTDLFHPNPNDPYLEAIQGTGETNEGTGNTIAVYAADSIRLNKHWQVNGGVRWDRFRLEYNPDSTTTLKRNDTMLSWRAGLVFKPVPQGSLYVGYGTSFNPTGEDLIVSNSSRNPGLSDLKPEKTRALEVGTKWELLDRRLFLNAAVFRTEKTNARTQDPDDPNDVLVLQGKQVAQGAELGLAGNLTEAWKVYAGYTFLDTEIKKSKDPAEVGKELSNSPRNSFNLWTTYDLLSNLQLGFGAQYVGKRFSNFTNTRAAPAYWIYDAMVGYRLSDNFSLRLNAQNLTDEKYIGFVGGGHFIPGVGRTILVSSVIDF